MYNPENIITLWDIPIYHNSLEELKNQIENVLNNEYNPIQIVTLNTDFLRIADNDEEFKNICKNSLIVLPDGIGITYLVKLKFNLKIIRITGNDILNIILDLSCKKHLKIAFLGSSESTLSKIKNQIQTKKLNVNITNLISPPLNFDNDNNLNMNIVDQLRRSKPQILFVSLGCPRQEKWINKYKDDIGIKIGVGIGAAMDYYSGNKRRSPLFLQRIGLEWFWRLMSEPKRLFRRYVLLDFPFFIKKVLELKK